MTRSEKQELIDKGLLLPLMEEFVYVDNEKYCWHDTLLNFLMSRNIINYFDPEMSLDLLFDLHFYPKMHCDESI